MHIACSVYTIPTQHVQHIRHKSMCSMHNRYSTHKTAPPFPLNSWGRSHLKVLRGEGRLIRPDGRCAPYVFRVTTFTHFWASAAPWAIAPHRTARCGTATALPSLKKGYCTAAGSSVLGHECCGLVVVLRFGSLVFVTSLTLSLFRPCPVLPWSSPFLFVVASFPFAWFSAALVAARRLVLDSSSRLVATLA
jgi:hypothetical protein